MKKTIVVLPTYNERENLPRLAAALLALNISGLEILVVDDNSPDGTGDIADALAASHPGRVHVLHRATKDGFGRAYVAGLNEALLQGADYIIQMDADFSHLPMYIPHMLEAINSCDIVVGSRYVKGSSLDESWSAFRRLLSWFANRVYLPTVLGLPVADATGGFRLWKRSTLIGIDLTRIRSNGYIFQAEMAYVVHRLGYSIREIPIHFPDRAEGESKMDINIQIEAALRAWQVRNHHLLLKPAMRITELTKV